MSYRLSVIGAGYLGVTHAACLAELGFEVVGVDTDADRVAALNEGRLPFFEPELAPMLQRHVESGRLRFSTEHADAAAFASVFFLCTGTPQRAGSMAADTSAVFGAAEALVPHLTSDALIVGKSTVPAGTAHALLTRLRQLCPVGVDVDVAWNPEFLREGNAVADTLRPDRLIFGVATRQAEKSLSEIYRDLLDAGVALVVTDLVTAELVKVCANAFLATKVSFVNAIAELCDVAGGDVAELTEGLGYDPRIGSAFLSAGLGFGGGCLPKDVRALRARAEELGAARVAGLLEQVDSINMSLRDDVVRRAVHACGGSVLGRRIAVWGAAFKPGTDDVRDSPALNVAARLQLQGAHVQVYDPQANANAARHFPTLNYADSAVEAAQDADVVLHLTEWPEFATVDPVALADQVRSPRLIDARNALDPGPWIDAGWEVQAPGRAAERAASSDAALIRHTRS